MRMSVFMSVAALLLHGAACGSDDDDGGLDAAPVVDALVEMDASAVACSASTQNVYAWSDLGVLPPMNPYDSTATVADLGDGPGGPLVTLSLDDGSAFAFSYGISDGSELPLTIGQELAVYIETYQPFWTELVIVLRTPPDDSGDSPLIAAMWNSSSALPGAALPELSLSYDNPGCPGVDLGCGDVVSLALYADDGADSVVVRAGEQASLGAYLLLNGSGSIRYTDTVLCTDTPPDWFTGLIRPQG